MSASDDIFTGDNPFIIARSWLAEAEATEPNDPNAIALATVDASGLPDARMVLLKEIEAHDDGGGAFVFYTNYESAKGTQIEATGKAAFVMHWKSLRRQIRVRGTVTREEGPQADDYYASRALQSRIGAWASAQSRPLSSRAALMAEVARQGAKHGTNPARPSFWGGYRIAPVQMEFWADGAFRLHNRFLWTKAEARAVAEGEIRGPWRVTRLSP
ncbi:pyridoxamine 5'-phosphate oxidase [Paracoccus sp. SCSIO 75233]|uniref:pyridoxamine 5'-phosphate oxidase n=1 Tax=Paracoccus sp. SCSIO 75233 TaxID=3017782 RepID=UPI0022F0C7A8|nr:pyridoxamine 5'-phosphate oxidase [Paracoccus sp. SCSIO 75233]WBU54258.1 pyridoxamine 5'-phosphate oxidase [Paracoccus sp. SCSIO 75233]